MSQDPIFSDEQFKKKAAWHKRQALLSLREKFELLLKLQAEDLELIKRSRPLKWHEKPWEIEP